MTFTIAEAQAKLSQIIAQAEAGEEIYIAREPDHPVVKLLPFVHTGAQLARHPDLVGSTATHDAAALANPLPTEEWGDLASR